jgi:hypothetical protein
MTHLLEEVVWEDAVDEATLAHVRGCARCRHEFQWLRTERRLFRERAARDEVQHLWQGVVSRTIEGQRPRRRVHGMAALAAGMLLMLAVGRLMVEGSRPSQGEASFVGRGEESLMTERAFSEERPELCSRAGVGIGFHCGGVVRASVLASR